MCSIRRERRLRPSYSPQPQWCSSQLPDRYISHSNKDKSFQNRSFLKRKYDLPRCYGHKAMPSQGNSCLLRSKREKTGAPLHLSKYPTTHSRAPSAGATASLITSRTQPWTLRGSQLQDRGGHNRPRSWHRRLDDHDTRKMEKRHVPAIYQDTTRGPSKTIQNHLGPSTKLADLPTNVGHCIATEYSLLQSNTVTLSYREGFWRNTIALMHQLPPSNS